jgi:hypothetical protein
LHVDWVSRDALLNDYEVNLNQLREMTNYLDFLSWNSFESTRRASSGRAV